MATASHGIIHQYLQGKVILNVTGDGRKKLGGRYLLTDSAKQRAGLDDPRGISCQGPLFPVLTSKQGKRGNVFLLRDVQNTIQNIKICISFQRATRLLTFALKTAY